MGVSSFFWCPPKAHVNVRAFDCLRNRVRVCVFTCPALRRLHCNAQNLRTARHHPHKVASVGALEEDVHGMLHEIVYFGVRDVDDRLGCPTATHGCFYSFHVGDADVGSGGAGRPARRLDRPDGQTVRRVGQGRKAIRMDVRALVTTGRQAGSQPNRRTDVQCLRCHCSKAPGDALGLIHTSRLFACSGRFTLHGAGIRRVRRWGGEARRSRHAAECGGRVPEGCEELQHVRRVHQEP
jgi:hypothetical protein